MLHVVHNLQPEAIGEVDPVFVIGDDLFSLETLGCLEPALQIVFQRLASKLIGIQEGIESLGSGELGQLLTTPPAGPVPHRKAAGRSPT